MNTDDIPQTPVETPATETPRRHIRLPRNLSPALAAALLALVLVGWQWFDTRQQLNALEQSAGKRLGEFDARNRESAIVAGQASEGAREALVKLGLVEQKLAESQNQQIALEALYQELSRNRDEWVLAEIEQILLTASQQLQLAGNARAALIALQTADSRLQRLDKPQFISLRKALNQDIQRLQALPMVDVAGYTLKLDNLAAAVDDLPLVVGDELPAERGIVRARPDDGLLSRLGREIWQDMKQLVRIQNLENPQAPLLAPSQSYFLRENLKLRLLSARLAVLHHDEPGFRTDLKVAEEWLRRYFDTQAKPTKSALATIRQLAAGQVSIEMPDISASLNAVRTLKPVARDRSGR